MEAISKPCTDCKLGKAATHKCITKSTPITKCRILIVGDKPSYFDDLNCTVFGSKSDALLDTILFSAIDDIPREAVQYTYALKCHDYGEKIGKKELDACKKYLQDDIQNADPEIIITIGEIAMTALTGLKTISKHRGKIYEINEAGKSYEVMPAYNCFYASKNTANSEQLAKDIYKAWNYINGVTTSISPTKVVICDTLDKVKQAIQYCIDARMAAFDFETTEIHEKKGIYYEGFYATGLSLSFQIGSAYFIPLEHKDSPFSKADVIHIMTLLKNGIFSNYLVRKVAHNLNFDCHVLAHYGIVVLSGRLDDTMLMHSLLDENSRHGLKELVGVYMPQFDGYDDEIKGLKWDAIPLPQMAQYGGTDTDMTLRLLTQFEQDLLQDPRLYKIYRNISMGAFRPLLEAEIRGMYVDESFLDKAIEEVQSMIEKREDFMRKHKVVRRYEEKVRIAKTDDAIAQTKEKLADFIQKRIDKKQAEIDRILSVEPSELAEQQLIDTVTKLEDEIEALSKGKGNRTGTKTEQNYLDKIEDLKTGVIVPYEGINFNSPVQLQDLFFYSIDGFSFPPGKDRYGNDNYSTEKVNIEDFDGDGFIDVFLAYKSLTKILGTYLQGLKDRLDRNGRVHTHYLINGTVTGRLSSRNPNLQNIPNIAKLSDEDIIRAVKLVKMCYGVPDGYTLLQGDYSQAELKAIADMANETTMLEAYKNGIDVHALTASKVIGISLEEFYELDEVERKKWRTRAKAVNFGFIYGMGAEKFKEMVKKDYKLVISIEEAERYRDTFFSLYPKLLEYHAKYEAKARKFGHVRTLYGRRRRLPDIYSDDYKKVADAQRQAVNAPIQGTCGEFTIFSIALLRDRLPHTVHFTNTVHDSIQYYIPDGLMSSMPKLIKSTCENLPNTQYFGVDLAHIGMSVDLEASKESWGKLEEVA